MPTPPLGPLMWTKGTTREVHREMSIFKFSYQNGNYLKELMTVGVWGVVHNGILIPEDM